MFNPTLTAAAAILRLLDIVHADQKLYLVFEFLDVDLKRYIETGNQNRNPIQADIVKVCCPSFFRHSISIRVLHSLLYTRDGDASGRELPMSLAYL